MVAWITLRCVKCKLKFSVFVSKFVLLQHVPVKMCRLLFLFVFSYCSFPCISVIICKILIVGLTIVYGNNFFISFFY